MAASVCDDDGDDASVCASTSMMGLATGETRWAGGGDLAQSYVFFVLYLDWKYVPDLFGQ